jgi:2-methoxy-6-polyprenyl-1,4-benzoquinol methylase
MSKTWSVPFLHGVKLWMHSLHWKVEEYQLNWLPSRSFSFKGVPLLRRSGVDCPGYREVPEIEKLKLMGNVFTSVAGNYDLMIDVMSMGLHRLWKDRLVSKLYSFPGMWHLDVSGGTGDVAFCVLHAIHHAIGKVGAESKAKNETHVHVCDIYPNTLEVGKQHAHKLGLVNVKDLVWMEGDAEALSLEDENMDGYTIAFGIHNVTHIDHALKEAHR